jgi:hypothetical protein
MNVGMGVGRDRQISPSSGVTHHCAKPSHRRPAAGTADRDIPERPDDLGSHNAVWMTGYEHADVFPGV